MMSLTFARALRRAPTAARSLTTTSNAFLPEDVQMLQSAVRDFADAELVPNAGRWDKNGEFDDSMRAAIRGIGDMGLMGVAIDPEYGGTGMDYLSYAVAMEEVSRGCATCGVVMTVNNTLYSYPVEKFGTHEQKQEFLTPYASGEKLGCFGLSEPGNGSDAGAASTTARDDGDAWVLNGTKAWITNSWEADCAVVMATTDKSLKHKGISAFLVPKGTPGFHAGEEGGQAGHPRELHGESHLRGLSRSERPPLGKSWRGVQAGHDDARQGTHRRGRPGAGDRPGLVRVRCVVAQQRKAFGGPISNFQMIQQKISSIATKNDQARLMTWHAAKLCDAGLPFTKEAAQAKLVASEAATYAAHQAMQVLGGMGYVSDMPAERHYRDARITEIYEGTSEIQHLVIAGQLLKEYAE